MTLKKIHVTEEDIEKGDKKDPCNCPVARAITRDLNLSYTIVVGIRGISLKNNKDIKLPRSVVRFISRFDDGKPVHPFNFQLNVL